MKKIIEKLQKILNVESISKMVLIFIVLQPIFDILSFLYIRKYIPVGISTIVKPLFIFGIGIFIYLTNKEQRKSYTKIFVVYAILLIIHCLILKDILVTNSVILHEIRFMINIAYMLVLFMIMDFLYQNHPDREKFIKSLKKTLVVTFFIYSDLGIDSVESTHVRRYLRFSPQFMASTDFPSVVLFILLPCMMLLEAKQHTSFPFFVSWFNTFRYCDF